MVCREVWPGEEFGQDGMSVDEEMESVRDILLNPAAGEVKVQVHIHNNYSICV